MFHMPVTWTHQDAAFSGVDVWTRPNSGNHNLRRVNHSASPRASLPPVVASKFSSSSSSSPVKVTPTIAASSQLPALISHSSKWWPSYRTFKGPRAPSTLNSGQSSRDPPGRFTNAPNCIPPYLLTHGYRHPARWNIPTSSYSAGNTPILKRFLAVSRTS